jgi:hypothetical protein
MNIKESPPTITTSTEPTAETIPPNEEGRTPLTPNRCTEQIAEQIAEPKAEPKEPKETRRRKKIKPIICIYKIEGYNKIYIGSTNDFNKRRNNHKCKSRLIRNSAVYYPQPIHRFIIENGGFNNFKMEIIEILPETTNKDNRRLKEYEKLKSLIESFEDLKDGFNKVLNRHLPIIKVRQTEAPI